MLREIMQAGLLILIYANHDPFFAFLQKQFPAIEFEFNMLKFYRYSVV